MGKEGEAVMVVLIPAAERVRTGRTGKICFKVPPAYKDYLEGLFRYQEVTRKSPTAYYQLKISTPKRPRTTGKNSQNHHINGHAQQIAIETGQPFEDVKRYAKQIAITMGYPILEDENGNPITDLWGNVQGISETDSSTEDAAKLIEALHMIAAEMDIKLIEE
jgi:hypothetical protein